MVQIALLQDVGRGGSLPCAGRDFRSSFTNGSARLLPTGSLAWHRVIYVKPDFRQGRLGTLTPIALNSRL